MREPVDIGASAFLASSIAASVNHELLRNVIFSAHGSYEQDAYQGAPRTDDRAGGGIALNYLMNRRIGLRVGYDYLQLTSSGADHINNYKDNKVSAGVTLQF